MCCVFALGGSARWYGSAERCLYSSLFPASFAVRSFFLLFEYARRPALCHRVRLIIVVRMFSFASLYRVGAAVAFGSKTRRWLGLSAASVMWLWSPSSFQSSFYVQ